MIHLEIYHDSSGEQCERLTVVDNERIYDECFPCRKNAKDYAADCLDEYTQQSTLRYLKEVHQVCIVCVAEGTVGPSKCIFLYSFCRFWKLAVNRANLRRDFV